MHRQIAMACQSIFDSGMPALNAARAALGLQPIAHLLDQFHVAEVELLATSRAFDFPADSLPEKVRYVGPQIADPTWARPWISPWPASDKRPLVLVGFSTTFQNHAAVLRKVIDALAPLPSRVLVTLGGSVHADELRSAPNCVIVESASAFAGHATCEPGRQSWRTWHRHGGSAESSPNAGHPAWPRSKRQRRSSHRARRRPVR